MPRREDPAPVAPIPPGAAPALPDVIRPGLLPVGPFSGSARHALTASALHLVSLFNDQINELRAAAERAKLAGNDELVAKIGDIAGRLEMRALELTMGKKMNLTLTLKSQDDLGDYRMVPPAVRARMDEALDEWEALQRPAIPVRALSSARMEP